MKRYDIEAWGDYEGCARLEIEEEDGGEWCKAKDLDKAMQRLRCMMSMMVTYGAGMHTPEAFRREIVKIIDLDLDPSHYESNEQMCPEFQKALDWFEVDG